MKKSGRQRSRNAERATKLKTFLARFRWGRRRRAARALIDRQAASIERFLTDIYPKLVEPGLTVVEGTSYHIGAFREASTHYGVDLRSLGGRRFEIVRDGAVVGRLHGMLTNLVSRDAVELCANKARTIALLDQAGVPVPRQRSFLRGQVEKALAFAARRDFEVVVKPCYGAGGSGVSTHIASAEDFHRAWDHAVRNLPPNRVQRVLVESRCRGMDIRAVVVAGRFSCAATRMPAHVIGDGRSTVTQLVASKNALKARHLEHGRYPILLNERATERLRAAGLSPETVLADGALLVLADVNNIHAGGESCEITDFLSPRIRAIAEQAARAVPGLGVVGVDLLATTLGDDAEVVVIEMNPRANLSVHHAPYRGRPQNPARDIVRVMLEQADDGSARDRVSSLEGRQKMD